MAHKEQPLIHHQISVMVDQGGLSFLDSPEQFSYASFADRVIGDQENSTDEKS